MVYEGKELNFRHSDRNCSSHSVVNVPQINNRENEEIDSNKHQSKNKNTASVVSMQSVLIAF